MSIHELGISPAQVAGVLHLRQAQAIGSAAADELFGLLCQSADSAEAVAQQRGLLQVSDTG